MDVRNSNPSPRSSKSKVTSAAVHTAGGDNGDDLSQDFSDLLQRASVLEHRREQKRERVRNLMNRLEINVANQDVPETQKKGSVRNLVNRFQTNAPTKTPAPVSLPKKISSAPSVSSTRPPVPAAPYLDNPLPPPPHAAAPSAIAIEAPAPFSKPNDEMEGRSTTSPAYEKKFRILNDPNTSPSEKLKIYLDSCNDAANENLDLDEELQAIDVPYISSSSHANAPSSQPSNSLEQGISRSVWDQPLDDTSQIIPIDAANADLPTPWRPKPLDKVIWNYATYSDNPEANSTMRLAETSSRTTGFVEIDIGNREGESDDYDYVEDDDEIFQDEFTAANEFVSEKRRKRRRLLGWICLVVLAFVAALSVILGLQASGDDNDDVMRPWTGDCFENKIELRMAVDRYLQDNSPFTDLAEAYGWPINSWCVSKIADFSNLFRAEVGDGGSPIRIAMFDEDISGWNVSRAKLMTKMFLGAPVFNSDLSKWDVRNVVDMESMFDDCPSFSSDLSSWDVSSVKNAKFMLQNAKQFNSDLSKWNFAPDTMDGMFSGAELFSSDLNNFDVSKVTDFADIFDGATSFNGNISNWNMKRAERLDRMFQNAELFDGDLSKWKMTPRSIGSMLFGARSFTGSRGLGNWDTSGINDMHAVFYKSKFQGDISSWNLGSTTTTRQMFEGCANFDGNISTWDVSKVKDFTSMFESAESFSSDLSSWNVTSGVKFDRMFAKAVSFNSDLSSWEVASAKTMSETFVNASMFSQNLCRWGPRLTSLDWNGTESSSKMLFGGTECPESSRNPNFSIVPPGPFCHPCS